MFPSAVFQWYILESVAPGYVLRPHLWPFLSPSQVLTSPCSKLIFWIAQWVLFFTGYSTIGEGHEGTLFIVNKQSLIHYDATDFYKTCINEWSTLCSFILGLFKMWEKIIWLCFYCPFSLLPVSLFELGNRWILAVPYSCLCWETLKHEEFCSHHSIQVDSEINSFTHKLITPTFLVQMLSDFAVDLQTRWMTASMFFFSFWFLGCFPLI